MVGDWVLGGTGPHSFNRLKLWPILCFKRLIISLVHSSSTIWWCTCSNQSLIFSNCERSVGVSLLCFHLFSTSSASSTKARNHLCICPHKSLASSAVLSFAVLFVFGVFGKLSSWTTWGPPQTQCSLSLVYLEGELPSCLRVMEAMEFIALSNNSLSGEFPSFLQNFTNLLVLDLSRNRLSGRLPMWIGKLTSLTILRLSHNKFSGNIPVNITNLACLQYLDLNNNKISGPLPSYFSNLERMIKKYVTGDCFHRNFFHLSSMSMDLKGQELNYGSINMVLGTSMMSIDLTI